MHLEGIWPVYRKDKEVGQCRFQRHGLYWLVDSQCTSQGAQVCRLWLISEGLTFNLGIPVPEGDGLSLRRRIAIKGLSVPGDFRLELKPLEESGVTSRDELSPSHTPPEPEATPQEKAVPIPPTQEKETPAEQQTASADSATARQAESATTEEATGTTAEKATGTTDETATAETVGISSEVTANPETEATPDEAASDAPTTEEPANNPTPDESATTNEPATEASTKAQEPLIPEAPETTPNGIPYDPHKPLPPLGNWESLRAVSDGHGGLLICTAGEDKAL